MLNQDDYPDTRFPPSGTPCLHALDRNSLGTSYARQPDGPGTQGLQEPAPGRNGSNLSTLASLTGNVVLKKAGKSPLWATRM